MMGDMTCAVPLLLATSFQPQVAGGTWSQSLAERKRGYGRSTEILGDLQYRYMLYVYRTYII